MPDPFVLVRPVGRFLPILISSPHSGRFYPAGEQRRLGVPDEMLSILNDGPVHELFEPAVQEGAALIHALWSRAWVDLNRDPVEMDAEAIDGIPARSSVRHSLRVQGGLGVVPTRLGERRVHQRRLAFAEVSERIAAVHQPYHAALETECARLAKAFGQALLLDCHSMPGTASGPGAVPDVALGDRYGRSCGRFLVAELETMLQGAGFSVARNRPFAGGWITERHGRPAGRIHALQIELRRDLFLAGTAQARAARSRFGILVQALTRRLGTLLTGGWSGGLQAAE